MPPSLLRALPSLHLLSGGPLGVFWWVNPQATSTTSKRLSHHPSHSPRLAGLGHRNECENRHLCRPESERNWKPAASSIPTLLLVFAVIF